MIGSRVAKLTKPHAGQPEPSFISRDSHRVQPALIEMPHCHAGQLSQHRSKTQKITLLEQITRLQANISQHWLRHVATSPLKIMSHIFNDVGELKPLAEPHTDLGHLAHIP